MASLFRDRLDLAFIWMDQIGPCYGDFSPQDLVLAKIYHRYEKLVRYTREANWDTWEPLDDTSFALAHESISETLHSALWALTMLNNSTLVEFCKAYLPSSYFPTTLDPVQAILRDKMPDVMLQIERETNAQVYATIIEPACRQGLFAKLPRELVTLIGDFLQA